MKETTLYIAGRKVRTVSLNTVVLGTGAAGYNAADRLYGLGQKDIAIVTEGVNCGTSRNTGSDKQTYYKLSLSGAAPDSVRALADVFYAGQGVDGDHALCEAALSARCFLKLAELGVPFPKNRYGEYVGYKTDHDPACRATSVGPYTSKQMTECLQKSVADKNIKVFDGMQAVKILTDKGVCKGLLCIDKNAVSEDRRFVIFNAVNVIMATGGPAGMYADSVYPQGHYGASGLAFEAGAKGKNLTEWQFGLASVRPRWNVSGTYMQVLPRFISTAADGSDEKEFLTDFFDDKSEMLSKVFLKGYQWPFDVRKLKEGSSIIDLLVYIETCIKGRRVYLDFRANPLKKAVNFKKLDKEAYDYLNKAEACFGAPIERLRHMNQPAVDFYLDKGVDLAAEPLEIALCAQHNNGGIAVNAWWQSDVTGLFIAGEAAGTHGVYRPGGSALNAGQVGSTRAAEFIAANRTAAPDTEVFAAECGAELAEVLALADKTVSAVVDNADTLYNQAAERMSHAGGAFRDAAKIKNALGEVEKELVSFADNVKVNSRADLHKVFRLHDTLICQYVYLSAMLNYADGGNGSRGSALYTNAKGKLPAPGLPEIFRFILDDEKRKDLTQEVSYRGGKCGFSWRQVRPIPADDDFFENVWRSFRENGNIY